MRVPKSICAITSFCDGGSSRYALGGVLFGRDNKKPFAVATDGRRIVHATWDEDSLAELEDEKPAGEAAGQQLIVPTGAVKELATLCNGSKAVGDKRFYLDETTATVAAKFSAKGTKRTVETQPIEGRFPKWKDVFPTTAPLAEIRMAGVLLLDSLKAVVAAIEARGTDTVTLEIIPDADGKPWTLRITGECNGKTVTALQCGMSRE